MVNPLYSRIFVFNYLPLVCGSVGQDSFNSFNSCSKKHHPHGKFVIFEKFVFNYFPLVSGSVGQDSFSSCSKKHYPHGKSVFIREIRGRIK